MARRTAALHQVTHDNAEGILRSAERRRRIVLEEAARAAAEPFEDERRRLEEKAALANAASEDAESDLSERQSELDLRQNALVATEQELETRRAEAEVRHSGVHTFRAQVEEVEKEFVAQLVGKLGVDREEWEAGVREQVLSAEKLGISRWLMDQQETLKAEARRYAKDALANVYVRYNPTFVWPKVPFSVEVPSKALAEKMLAEGAPLLALVTEGTETAVEAMSSSHAAADDKTGPTLKISGGAGVDKEVIRLSLEEIFTRNVQNPDKIRAVVAKHRKNTDKFILKLGEEALRILGLPNDMNPEILKLIGSLNYRTSHRQNQYFHSLEVARLAGMLADEVGVDSALAKRSGLLHDIGKVLDWKIEGSHAVISGDYATRYGEREDVVDTVLAHHDDKLVETPHAFILKAADAMSGARPGARVDMEEGYQNRLASINDVVTSFSGRGVLGNVIMHAGREIHVFVDNRRVKQDGMEKLAQEICHKLQSDVQFPGQIRVTVVRRLEVSEVA
jgi:ribonuclease Y